MTMWPGIGGIRPASGMRQELLRLEGPPRDDPGDCARPKLVARLASTRGKLPCTTGAAPTTPAAPRCLGAGDAAREAASVEGARGALPSEFCEPVRGGQPWPWLPKELREPAQNCDPNGPGLVGPGDAALLPRDKDLSRCRCSYSSTACSRNRACSQAIRMDRSRSTPKSSIGCCGGTAEKVSRWCAGTRATNGEPAVRPPSDFATSSACLR
mmetsp:Transcript_82310/g.266495  ORF Transcript_82310/g.266495 Transcript_82310/m.266495 type:complete len:212 (+) Transcript_82310:179-814(+)